jgi:amino acid adenylation domain-containing protein
MRMERLVSPFASATPDRVAVDGPSESITYGELDRLANRIAHTLKACGVEPGDRVGVHLPRSGRAIAAMLGALRAGAVYVPLDPGSPATRLRLIAKDCGLRHLVIAPQLLKGWLAAPGDDPVVHFILSAEAEPSGAVSSGSPATVHSWAEVTRASDAALPLRSQSPDDLAYLLYTSGSTGVPKGVMLSHRNALAFVHWAAELIELGAKDRVASVAPFHFDLSVFDVWSSLSRGATIVIVDEAMVVSGPRMVERIRQKEITVWYSVPTAITLMLEAGKLGDGGAPSLRSVFFAGEVFPVKHLRRAMETLPAARFFNLFGPTETNVCTAYEVPAPPPPEATAIPIGHASCGDTATILDPEGKAVADGEVGELFIEGPTVMLGYWEGGKRTPAKHPYPTGDLVSRRPDGELMYHGRRDHMVKVHGFRVELGEVEVAIQCHPAVREAIVLPHASELVAVVVPSDPALSVLELKRHCAARLPKYMVPYGVRLVQDLPRTSSGKADRVRTAAAVREDDRSVLVPVVFENAGARDTREKGAP